MTAPAPAPSPSPSLPRPARRWRWSPFALVGLFLIVFSLGVGEMWLYGHHGWCGARRGIAGVNTVKHGYLDTRFGPVENYGEAKPEDFSYYWHHPVLTNVLVGASFHLFGPREAAARLVPILASLMSLLVLYHLTRRWWGAHGAVAAGLALILLPANAVYGKLVNPEALVLALALGLAWTRLRFESERRWRWVVAGGLITLLGAFSDWPYFLVLGAYGLIDGVRQLRRWRRDRDLRFLSIQVLVGAVGLALVAWYLLSLKGGGGSFASLFSDRSSGGGGLDGLAVLWQRRAWYLDLLSPFGLVAWLVWALALPFRARRGALRAWDALIGASSLAGLAWMILFGKSANIHEYWCFYLIPAVALSLAWLAEVATRALGGAGAWPARIALSLLLAGFAATSGAVILERQATPSDIGREAPEFRFRHAVFAQWLRERMAPDERLLVQKDFPIRQQVGFYLDRDLSRVRLDAGFRRLSRHQERRHRYLVLDRVMLPLEARVPVLRELAKRYPVTFFDRFCVFDLQAPDNEAERIEAHRIVLEAPTALWRWFVSLVYPPYRLEPSAADAFQWALTLRLDRAAERLAAAELATETAGPGLRSPDESQGRLADLVAAANAARLRGGDPSLAEGELERLLGSPLGFRFEGVGQLLWAWSSPYPGGRIATALVFRAEAEGEEHLRPWTHRRERLPAGDARQPATHRVWRHFEPLPEAWREGMLYLDTFFYWAEPVPQELLFFLDRKSPPSPKRGRIPVEGPSENDRVTIPLPAELVR